MLLAYRLFYFQARKLKANLAFGQRDVRDSGLTNGRPSNLAPEDEFSTFRALWWSRLSFLCLSIAKSALKNPQSLTLCVARVCRQIKQASDNETKTTKLINNSNNNNKSNKYCVLRKNWFPSQPLGPFQPCWVFTRLTGKGLPQSSSSIHQCRTFLNKYI